MRLTQGLGKTESEYRLPEDAEETRETSAAFLDPIKYVSFEPGLNSNRKASPAALTRGRSE